MQGLRVNRSTYDKYFSSPVAPRTLYNRKLRSLILEVDAASKKRLGTNKIRFVLNRDYGIYYDPIHHFL